MVYDLVAALDNPRRLDSYGDVFDMRGLIQAEIDGACFAGDDVVVSTSPEPTPTGRTTSRPTCWPAGPRPTAGSYGSDSYPRLPATCFP
jgi:hypothetical protein